MKVLMLLLLPFLQLVCAAPIAVVYNDELGLQQPKTDHSLLVSQGGPVATSSPSSPLRPLRADVAPGTRMDVESELRRLGLEQLDLQERVRTVDYGRLQRHYWNLQSLSPASSYRAKARVLACLVSGSDRPPRSLIWEYEWSIFYNDYRQASATDERTRELVEYYYDQLKRAQVHSSIQERAAAIAKLVSLTASPSRLLVQRLEREVPRDFEAYVSSAREWASGVVAGYLSPIHAAWNTVARYYSAVREH